MKCDRDWGCVENEESATHTKTTSKGRRRRWKTIAQLQAIYGDAEVAKAIADECKLETAPAGNKIH